MPCFGIAQLGENIIQTDNHFMSVGLLLKTQVESAQIPKRDKDIDGNEGERKGIPQTKPSRWGGELGR